MRKATDTVAPSMQQRKAGRQNSRKRGKVAPGFLPRFLAGPYSIVDYKRKWDMQGPKGYAIVVGGEPNAKSNGKCKIKNRRINSSGGLWIFTRESTRNQKLIEEVKNKAEENFGLNTSFLNRVDHTNCNYGTDDGNAAVAIQRSSRSALKFLESNHNP